MFWKRKNKLPITPEDKIWVDEDLHWLKEELGEKHFLEIKTVTPTKDFYNRDFDGSEQDAHFVLKRTMELMSIGDIDIKLEFFDDDVVEMEDGSILSTPTEGIEGRWESAAGTYEINQDEEVIISISTRKLNDPISLIATISHELSHQILLGEQRIEENDEFLTDLTAITYGFGIFIGNSRFNFSQFATNDGHGWKYSGQGYLPEQIIAYAMAWLSKERNENTSYSQYMKKSVKKYFNSSFEYLTKNK